MSQGFKLKYNEMRENDPSLTQAVQDTGNGAKHGCMYEDVGHIRNLCFVATDGKRTFLNYNYLIAGELSSNEETVILSFTTHLVVLKGINLTSLYNHLMGQEIRLIGCEDERYNVLTPDNQPVVNSIHISATG